MALDALVDNVWVAVLAWAVLFTLDYALTLRGARLARAAGLHIAFHGGYELTPIYREDVAALRRMSPRLAAVLSSWQSSSSSSGSSRTSSACPPLGSRVCLA
ncbi:MAG TPA: hypothetical protein VGR49_01595 [Actinomycetota bacterium]|nr:hypothetical protein [Actinomycetota bacterium]